MTMKNKQSSDDKKQKAISHIKSTGAICIVIGILVPLVAILRVYVLETNNTDLIIASVAISIWFLWIGITLYKLPSATKAKVCLILALISSLLLATGVIPVLSLISSILGLINLKHYRASQDNNPASDESFLTSYAAFTAVNRYSLRLTNAINDSGKLSNLEGVHATFLSIALMYVLVDRQAHMSLSASQRVVFCDDLLDEIIEFLTDKLGTKREPSIKLLNTNIKLLGQFANKLAPAETDKGFKGTLFWEFGRTMEKRLENTELSQIELSMMAMEIGGDLVAELRPATNKRHHKSNKPSRKYNILKTIAIVGVAIIVLAWIIDTSEANSQCQDEVASLKRQVEISEKYLDETEERARDSDVAVEYYNKHVPEHNKYVAAYNAKLAECR